MNLERQLKESLQEKGNEIQPSQQLKMKVMNPAERIRTKRKKRLATGMIVTMLLVPTGAAVASQSLLADEIYGSFENLKKHVVSATIEGFMLFNAKLSQAKGELGEVEYKEFKGHIKTISNGKLDYSNEYGSIDYDKVPAAEYEKLKQALFHAQPFFDRLNGDPSSRELLSAAEYEQYISAQLVHETILAQNNVNVNEYYDADEVIKIRQAEYEAAQASIDRVNERQQQARQ
ncbi:MAG: DUF3600 domain-containing protein [Bacillus sp. (in: firmicutes)]